MVSLCPQTYQDICTSNTNILECPKKSTLDLKKHLKVPSKSIQDPFPSYPENEEAVIMSSELKECLASPPWLPHSQVKHFVPMVLGTKASSPHPWNIRVCCRIYGTLEDLFSMLESPSSMTPFAYVNKYRVLQTPRFSVRKILTK